MSFKMTTTQCQQVIRDNPGEVYTERLDKLYYELSLATGEMVIYRLQGQISMLLEIISLKDKADSQLERK